MSIYRDARFEKQEYREESQIRGGGWRSCCWKSGVSRRSILWGRGSVCFLFGALQTSTLDDQWIKTGREGERGWRGWARVLRISQEGYQRISRTRQLRCPISDIDASITSHKSITSKPQPSRTPENHPLSRSHVWHGFKSALPETPTYMPSFDYPPSLTSKAISHSEVSPVYPFLSYHFFPLHSLQREYCSCGNSNVQRSEQFFKPTNKSLLLL